MDYAEGKHSDQIISDAKYVFPLIVMFLPLPFFWALFDMKGVGSYIWPFVESGRDIVLRTKVQTFAF